MMSDFQLNQTQSLITKKQKRVREKLSSNQVLVLFSNPQTPSHCLPINGAFRACSNFYYATGINAPDLIAMITEKSTFIFAPKYPKERYFWESDLLGFSELHHQKKQFAIDEVYPLFDFSKQFTEVVKTSLIDELIFPLFGSLQSSRFSLNDELEKAIKKLKSFVSRAHPSFISKFIDAQSFFQSIRLIKFQEEIELMEKAAKISANAHCYLIKNIKKSQSEKDLMNWFLYEVMANGADGLAYPSIVAAGQNGCILHYKNNQEKINKNDLVLIDAGCTYQSYTADITRVIPKSGRFIGAQRDLYQRVYQLQVELIDSILESNHWLQLEKLTQKLISQALIDLKLVNESLDTVIEQALYKPFYMHSVGHYLGLDVHDDCVYRDKLNQPIPFTAGMTFTIEPGIYIHPSLNVPDEFKSLAIRIEDDIVLENLVKNKDANNQELRVRVLSKNAAKKITDIEQMIDD